MPDETTAKAVTTASTSPAQGQPTTASVQTSVLVPGPAAGPANPFFNTQYVTEAGSFLLLIGGVWALIENRINKRRKEDADVHRLSHDAIEKDVSDVKHKVNNERSRIDALEHNRTADVERIIKLELNHQNIEKSLSRVETNQERNHQEVISAMDKWAVQFSDSIREIRDVKPRS